MSGHDMTLKIDDDPVKNWYKEISDWFEEKVLTIALAHFITNLNECDPSEFLEGTIDHPEQADLLEHLTARSCSITISIDSKEIK